MLAAYRTTVVYSLISCCKSADIVQRFWLEDILNKLPAYEKEGKDVQCCSLFIGKYTLPKTRACSPRNGQLTQTWDLILAGLDISL